MPWLRDAAFCSRHDPRLGMTAKKPTTIDALTFEEALSELESIVQKLEKGEGGLAEAIAAYERGEQLRQHCESKLSEARTRIEKIVKGPNGDPGSVPLDEE